jgi:hypothetical protein
MANLSGPTCAETRFVVLEHELICTRGCRQVLLECNHLGLRLIESHDRWAPSVARAGRVRPNYLACFSSRIRTHGANDADVYTL